MLENELVQKSILEIRSLKKKISVLEAEKSEEIAIVGIACTFPGDVSSAEEYWQFILNKKDGICAPVESRWNQTNIANIDYHTDLFNGGFVSYDVSTFDPLFFGIPPKEAKYMDPQQRLFLEDTWKALINAGIDPKTIHGTNAGVFCGMTNSEYLQMMLRELPSKELNGYITSGNCLNFAAGRVSYILGLQGPSLAVDTACSSSLVAIHLAVQSLKNHECNMAIAGGVNLMLNPETFLLLESGNMLSPDGRCNTFSDSANGYARGEGCGVVILKRLSDAIKEGCRIYATIKDTVVKHDGRKSGLTVPIASSQKILLKEALSKTRIEAKDIVYSEAHGTGTFLGDPVELEALNAVYGEGHTKEKPLYIGSIKSNFGHLEAAAGVAGLIKVALSIYNKKIPAHFPIDKLNSNFDWENSQLQVVSENLDWPENIEKVASISSFGASGTNAHAILGESTVSTSKDFFDRSRALSLLEFKKQQCWYKPLSANMNPKGVEIVKEFQKIDANSSINNASYLVSLDIDSVPTIREHRIFDTVILTGSIYLDIALTITKELTGEGSLSKFSFGNVTLLRPIVFDGQFINLRVTFEALDFVNQDKSYRIQMFPQNIDGKSGDAMYSSIDIQVVAHESDKLGKSYLDSMINRCDEELDASNFYNDFWKGKFHIGKPFHIFDKVWRNDGQIAIGVCRPKDFIKRTRAYGLNPESLIAYLMGLLFKSALPRNRIIEFGLQDKIFIGTGYDAGLFYESLLKDNLYAIAEIKKVSKDDCQYNGDVTMVDSEGSVICKMTNIAFQAIGKNEIPQASMPEQKSFTKDHGSDKSMVHPILGEKFAGIKDWVVATELKYDTYPLIGDHLTFDYALLPAVGYINLASKSIKKINKNYKFTKLENLEITQPLMLHKGDKYKIRTAIDKLSPHDYSYNIYAYSSKKNIINKEWSLSCRGDFTDLPQIPEEKIEFNPDILSTFGSKYNTEEFFKTFWGDDFFLGESYHFIDSVYRKEYEVIGVIKNFMNYKEKTGITDLSGGFLQIYMSLPLAMAAVPDEYLTKVQKSKSTCIAKSAKSFVIYDDNGLDQYNELWAHAVLVDKEVLDNKWITDFKFYNEKGVLVAKVDGAEFHIMKKEALEILKQSMEQVEINEHTGSIEVVPFLEKTISEIVGINIEQLSDNLHLGELMDSIMALQLRAKIEKNLAILLPLNNIAKTKSIDELAYEIISRSNGLLK